jgi:hypothetical protein
MRYRFSFIAVLMSLVAAGCGSDVVPTETAPDSGTAASADTGPVDDSAIRVVLVRPDDWPNARFYPSSAEVVVGTDEEIVATTTLDGATVEIELPSPGEYRISAVAEAEDGECWHYAGWPEITANALAMVDGDTTLELIDSGEVCN